MSLFSDGQACLVNGCVPVLCHQTNLTADQVPCRLPDCHGLLRSASICVPEPQVPVSVAHEQIDFAAFGCRL
jgi:hypothetical protein